LTDPYNWVIQFEQAETNLVGEVGEGQLMAAIDLKTLVSQESTGIDEIASHLDAGAPEERVEALFALDRAGQRALFNKAESSAPLTLDDFVPPDREPGEPVRHRGRNTLPFTARHKLFKKCFCRPEDGTPRLFGYNDAPSRGLIGPGYFVAVPTAANPDWGARGAVVVDYFQVPDGKVADGWPAIMPNSKGLQRFVYNRTRDFMRRVSNFVTIGAAFRGEKALDHYFVLVREV
jgi:hypothetical protein